MVYDGLHTQLYDTIMVFFPSFVPYKDVHRRCHSLYMLELLRFTLGMFMYVLHIPIIIQNYINTSKVDFNISMEKYHTLYPHTYVDILYHTTIRCYNGILTIIRAT